MGCLLLLLIWHFIVNHKHFGILHDTNVSHSEMPYRKKDIIKNIINNDSIVYFFLFLYEHSGNCTYSIWNWSYYHMARVFICNNHYTLTSKYNFSYSASQMSRNRLAIRQVLLHYLSIFGFTSYMQETPIIPLQFLLTWACPRKASVSAIKPRSEVYRITQIRHFKNWRLLRKRLHYGKSLKCILRPCMS